MPVARCLVPQDGPWGITALVTCVLLPDGTGGEPWAMSEESTVALPHQSRAARLRRLRLAAMCLSPLGRDVGARG